MVAYFSDSPIFVTIKLVLLGGENDAPTLLPWLTRPFHGIHPRKLSVLASARGTVSEGDGMTTTSPTHCRPNVVEHPPGEDQCPLAGNTFQRRDPLALSSCIGFV